MAGTGDVSTPAVAAAGAGALVLWGALKGISPTKALLSLLQGKQPSTANTQPITGASGGTGSAAVASAGTVTATGGTVTGAQERMNQALGQAAAATYGWAGAQWTALNNIIMAESGWNNLAQNPGSTAYGIFQFLDTTWASTGYTKTSNPAIQIAAGLVYVKERYGDPAKAWAFHLANGWY